MASRTRRSHALAALAMATLLLSGCALLFPADSPLRTSISLSVPSDMGRPPWLQRRVALMDADWDRPIALKLSYALAPPSGVGAAVARGN
ncbi:MAG TPA: hypothetical protein VHL79_22685 [Ramlibacter sp.]|nr:hypothetical protein [Ramlibacter sp.]